MKFLYLGFLVTTWVYAGAWDKNNDPKYFEVISGEQLETNFSRLALRGSTDKKVWSDTFWPNNLGSISYRTKTSERAKCPSKDSLLKMLPLERMNLSPAEKYDIMSGNYDYKFTNLIASTTHSDEPSWAGVGNGWALASLIESEPSKNIIIKNSDGIEVIFSPSDIKALLAYYYSYSRDSDDHYARIGLRCLRQDDRQKCNDLNPASFHIVLANLLGEKRLGIIADTDSYSPVFNQPISKFVSEVLSKNTTSAHIRTTLVYVDYNDKTTEEVLEYSLNLDKLGNITGGQWISGEIPDFVWTKKRSPNARRFASRINRYSAHPVFMNNLDKLVK